ncbi:PTS sugar transporter subunit IIC [Spiroplasma endosymbiont of Labia minor]|uniref:PTS sugar transporter subunit IIC n=1 Tax=Spiroplasma endosymbiont of Labia minor TaxID=3066305 RepID=UPI0030D589D5
MDNNKDKFDVKNVREKNKSNFKDWFSNKFLPTMTKIGNQRYLAAIRDSFGTMIPLIIAGSIGVLINAIIFGGAGSGYVSLLGLIVKLANPNMAWQDISKLLGDPTNSWGQVSLICGQAFGTMSSATIGLMSIYFSFLFGYYIALSRGFKSPVIAGLISVASFVLVCLGQVTFFMDAKGLIAAIIFGIISTELFIWFGNMHSLNIKLPDGVPPAVGKSFQVFLPAVFTLAIIGASNIIFLAPAIITTHWAVTQSTFSVYEDDWSMMIDKAVALVKAGSFGNWITYKDALVRFFNEYNSSFTADQMNDFFNTFSASEKSAITTFIVGGGESSLFHSIDSGAKLVFTFDDVNNKWIVSASWIINALNSTVFGFGAAIYQFITSWFMNFATGSGGLGLAVVFVFFVSFFWFFGIHGSNLMAGIFEPIWWMILGVNTALVNGMGYANAAATGDMGVFTKPFFDSYMYIGGSGATLGLLIGTFAFSKRRDLKEIAKYATPAGVFQINEPAIFGVPLILNPIYVVPFIVAPLLNLVVGWLFSPAALDIVKYSYVTTPWTAPWFVGAVITSLDGKALIPAFIAFGVDFALYMPFIWIDNLVYFKKLRKNDPEKYKLEMRYYHDSEFRFTENTNTKYNNLVETAEYAIVSAQNRNDFLASLRFKPEKLKMMQDKNLANAEIKRTIKLKKAEDFKAKRIEIAETRKPKWDKQLDKKNSKKTP